jgi:hypothetical protein
VGRYPIKACTISYKAARVYIKAVSSAGSSMVWAVLFSYRFMETSAQFAFGLDIPSKVITSVKKHVSAHIHE